MHIQHLKTALQKLQRKLGDSHDKLLALSRRDESGSAASGNQGEEERHGSIGTLTIQPSANPSIRRACSSALAESAA